MAVTYMGKTYGSLAENENGIINTTINYIFHFDDAESPVDIFAQSEVPARNTQHPSGNGLYALTRAISKPEEGDEIKSGKYIVTVIYSNDLRINNVSESSSNELAPWKLPPYDISIFPLDVTKSLIKAYAAGDKKGSPSVHVVNSANDPFDVQTVEQNTIYRFSYNLRNFRDYWIDSYADTVNNSSITVIDKTIPRFKGRLRNIGGTFQRIYDENGTIKYKYWKVDIEIEKSPEIWQIELMQLGFYFIDAGDSNKKKPIYTDGEGGFGARQTLIEDLVTGEDTEEDAKEKVTLVSNPQKLGDNGELLGVVATPKYETFSPKAMVGWRSLNMPKTTTGQTNTPRLLL